MKRNLELLQKFIIIYQRKDLTFEEISRFFTQAIWNDIQKLIGKIEISVEDIRDFFLTQVANFAEQQGIPFDKNKPDFLKIQLEISRLIEVSDQQQVSIPPNLEKLVEDLEEAEERRVLVRQKALFRRAETRERYEQLKAELRAEIYKSKIPALVANPLLVDMVVQDATDQLLEHLPPVGLASALPLGDFESSTIEQFVKPRIVDDFHLAGISLSTIRRLPIIASSALAQATLSTAQNLAVIYRPQPIAEATKIGSEKLSPSEIKLYQEQAAQARDFLQERIVSKLPQTIGVPSYVTPEKQRKLGRTALKAVRDLVMKEQPKDEREFKKTLKRNWSKIERELQERGKISAPQPEQKDAFIEDLSSKENWRHVKVLVLPPELRPSAQTNARLAQRAAEGATWPAYPLLQPRLAIGYVLSFVTAMPIKKALETAVTKAPYNSEEINRLTTEIQADIETLKGVDLPPARVAISKLRAAQTYLARIPSQTSAEADFTLQRARGERIRVFKEAQKALGEGISDQIVPREIEARIAEVAQQPQNIVASETVTSQISRKQELIDRIEVADQNLDRWGVASTAPARKRLQAEKSQIENLPVVPSPRQTRIAGYQVQILLADTYKAAIDSIETKGVIPERASLKAIGEEVQREVPEIVTLVEAKTELIESLERTDLALYRAGFSETSPQRQEIRSSIDETKSPRTSITPAKLKAIESQRAKSLQSAFESLSADHPEIQALQDETKVTTPQLAVVSTTATEMKIGFIERLEKTATILEQAGFSSQAADIRAEIREIQPNQVSITAQDAQAIESQRSQHLQTAFASLPPDHPLYDTLKSEVQVEAPRLVALIEAKSQTIERLERAASVLTQAGLPESSPEVKEIRAQIRSIEAGQTIPGFSEIQSVEARRVELLQSGLETLEGQPVAVSEEQVADVRTEMAQSLKQALLPTIAEMNFEQREILDLMITQGLTSADLTASIDYLRETSPDHPQIPLLEELRSKVITIENNNPNVLKILERFWRPFKEAGHEISVPDIGTLPRLSPAPIRGFFQNLLNRIGFYKPTELSSGKIVYRSILSQFSERFVGFISGGRFASFSQLGSHLYQATLGRVFGTIAQSGLGQAVKAGLSQIGNKAASWIAKKLGVQLATKAGILAAGAAGAPASGGLSLVIAVVLELAKKLLSLIKRGLKKIFNDPDKALKSLLIGAAFLILLPLPLALLGIIPIALGLIGIGLNIAAATAFFTAQVASFTIAFIVAPMTEALALLTIAFIVGSAILTLFIVYMTASAFIIPNQPAEVTPPGQEYFQVFKGASPDKILNSELPKEVTYAVHVESTDNNHPLEITSITDERSVSCKTNNPSFPSITITPPPGLNATWDTTYTFPFGNGPDPINDFRDCRACNTIHIYANIPSLNLTNIEGSSSKCVEIGSPPEDCPSGWPTSYGTITQGPDGGYSHVGQEAIDVGVVYGTNVSATHQGMVIDTIPGEGGVVVSGTCEVAGVSQPFYTLYWHLSSINVTKNSNIVKGAKIGESGFGGTGAHLHYEFSAPSGSPPFDMASPYIPISDDILRGCNGAPDCNLSW